MPEALSRSSRAGDGSEAAGLFAVHAEFLDGSGVRLAGSGELPSRLQVIDDRPTFAVDVDLVLARPSATPVLRALRNAGCELFYFDLASLRRLLSDEGFEIVSHRYVSLTVTWQYALRRLGALLGTSAFERVPRVVGERSVRINCYYDLMVSARVL